MTPLAKDITKDSIRRNNGKYIGVYNKEIVDAQMFDVSKIHEFACANSPNIINKNGSFLFNDLFFLPSNPTWIEWIDDTGERLGIFLKKLDSTDHMVFEFFKNGPSRSILGVFENVFEESDVNKMGFRETKHSSGLLSPEDTTNFYTEVFRIITIHLAFINTPRIIGRKIHLPHASFQRKLAKAKGTIGKYPIQAWTELILEVTPPKDESDAPACETVLTGEKALHFVRSHLRIVGGKLVRVSAHWRGNAALGIKRTRYSVVPPKNGVWPEYAGALP
ncbi:hypothetical protein [Acetobacter persici]|uniref:Uncharacterized protein n=1 Tax=Acetobacter persici TaxID=1076596 RepID=A0A6V8ICS3_9PROT|nr:hypothetical protein [Acetobacter persici]GFE94892.1 hypothetical protein DmAi_29510 [Acetobacter persici]